MNWKKIQCRIFKRFCMGVGRGYYTHFRSDLCRLLCERCYFKQVKKAGAIWTVRTMLSVGVDERTVTKEDVQEGLRNAVKNGFIDREDAEGACNEGGEIRV